MLRALAFILVLALAACGGSPPPPVVYKPLDYSYLPPILLKVSTVNVVNAYVPDPAGATLIGDAPEAPANALSDMLNRRLLPAGTPGTATATIEAASLEEDGGNLTGVMTVRLDVQSEDGHSSGYTEASVTHSAPAPDPDADQPTVQAALYAMTRQLMDAMNVQLQYQIQQNLGSWVSYSSSEAVAPLATGGGIAGGIQATPLSAPGGSAPGAAAPDTTAPVPAIGVPNAVPQGQSLIPPGFPGAAPSP